MHRTAITQTRLDNWLKAGRGFGFFSTYQPWIQVSRQDRGSHGYSHQIPNPFIGRSHHLLSNLEKAVFRINQALPEITDIREQFPIWPATHPSPLLALRHHLGEIQNAEQYLHTVRGSLSIAHSLNLFHNDYVGLNQPYVYTTDQLLTVQRHGKPSELIAVAIKCRMELRGHKKNEKRSTRASRTQHRRSVFRKLRLERAYWQAQGIPWVLVTDRQIDSWVVRNLEFGHSSWQQHPPSPAQWVNLKKLRSAISPNRKKESCKWLLESFAAAAQLPFEEAVRLFKLGLITGILPLDLRRPIVLTLPIPWESARDNAQLPSWSPLRKIWKKL